MDNSNTNDSGDWTAVNEKIRIYEERRAEPLECRDSFIKIRFMSIKKVSRQIAVCN
jgi:hypothetical protein